MASTPQPTGSTAYRVYHLKVPHFRQLWQTATQIHFWPLGSGPESPSSKLPWITSFCPTCQLPKCKPYISPHTYSQTVLLLSSVNLGSFFPSTFSSCHCQLFPTGILKPNWNLALAGGLFFPHSLPLGDILVVFPSSVWSSREMCWDPNPKVPYEIPKTLFKHTVFAGETKVRWGHTIVEWIPVPWLTFLKNGEFWTQVCIETTQLCDNRGRD